MSSIRDLRAAALPFVTRSLRGARGRRFAALSLVIALLTLIAGSWLALGSGELERGVREDLGVEMRRFDRERRELVIVINDDVEYQQALRERARLLERGLEGPRATTLFEERVLTAQLMLQDARQSLGDIEAQHYPELRERVAATVEPAGFDRHGRVRGTTFDWNNGIHIEMLRSILDREGIPTVERYASPLDGHGAVGFAGLIACALLLVLTTVIGPVFTGIAIAQESHENTLQPVAGTALSPRQIALGLVLGALAPVAIVAAPQVLVAAIAGVVAGDAVALVGFFALLVPCAWAVTMLAATVGLFAGRRRGTGAVGITLLAGLATWLLSGLALGFDDIDRGEAAVITLLPSGGLFRGIHDAFLGAADPLRCDGGLGWRLVAAAIASLVVGALALRATERRVPGRFVAPLHRSEVLLGSGVLSALVLLAVSHVDGAETFFVSLAVMVMPMQVLIMARVPSGDAPSGRGVVRLPQLLGEFAGFVGLHAALALLITGPAFLLELASTGMLHLVWALGIAALVAIRVVAGAARLPASIFAGFAFVVAIVEFAMGSAQCLDGSDSSPFLAMWLASPLLGLVQLALLVLMPWALVRGIVGGRTLVPNDP